MKYLVCFSIVVFFACTTLDRTVDRSSEMSPDPGMEANIAGIESREGRLKKIDEKKVREDAGKMNFCSQGGSEGKSSDENLKDHYERHKRDFEDTFFEVHSKESYLTSAQKIIRDGAYNHDHNSFKVMMISKNGNKKSATVGLDQELSCITTFTIKKLTGSTF